MRYVTKPIPVEIERWIDADNPLPGVHDLFYIPGKQPAGYLSTHEGDRIVHLGDWIAYFTDGHREVLTDEELETRFVKDEQ